LECWKIADEPILVSEMLQLQKNCDPKSCLMRLTKAHLKHREKNFDLY
jgi:hypothetical protein